MDHKMEKSCDNALNYYREVQIHGQVLFNRDFARIVGDAAGLSRSCKEKVEQFGRKNSIPVEWLDMR